MSRGWNGRLKCSAPLVIWPAPQVLASGVNLVLDHFTLPDPKLGIADPGFAALLKLGASRRLWVKISAPYRNGPEGEKFARAHSGESEGSVSVLDELKMPLPPPFETPLRGASG